MPLLDINPESGKTARMGMGALHLSVGARPAPNDAIAVIHCALASGIRFFDTADCYCDDESEQNHNERLLQRALSSYGNGADSAVIATKGGIVRPGGQWIPRGDPEYLRAAILRSFEALGEKPIDLWQLHAPDPHVPLRESLSAPVWGIRNGLVRRIGLCNVTLQQIKEAQEVVEIAAVQNRHNLWHRDPEFDGVIEYCESAGITFLSWGPLGGAHDHHRLAQTPYFGTLAAKYQVSVYSILLAWVLAKSPCIIPIPGTSKPQHINAWIHACNLKLMPQELFRMECSVFRATLPSSFVTQEIYLTQVPDAQ
jgi:aryl-alcohol dehydrogenase-like predicted oxidoreductase